MQTLTNVVIQKFVQQTLSVLTPTAATTANAVMDTQGMTMVRVRVSKLRRMFQFYDLCLLFLLLQIIEQECKEILSDSSQLGLIKPSTRS